MAQGTISQSQPKGINRVRSQFRTTISPATQNAERNCAVTLLIPPAQKLQVDAHHTCHCLHRPGSQSGQPYAHHRAGYSKFVLYRQHYVGQNLQPLPYSTDRQLWPRLHKRSCANIYPITSADIAGAATKNRANRRPRTSV